VKNKIGWAYGMCGGTGEVHTGFWWGNPMEGDHVKCLSLDGRIIIKGSYRIEDGEAWSGLIWLETGMGGGHL